MPKRVKGTRAKAQVKKAKPGFKSPLEIEEEVISTKTVTFDPYTVLPKEIYVEIFNMLEDPSDKQNFMNAHPSWYELFKSQRASFLFSKVFPVLVDGKTKSRANFVTENKRELPDLRLVCRKWDRGIQDYIQFHPANTKVKDEKGAAIWVGAETIFLKEEEDYKVSKEFNWSNYDFYLRMDMEQFSATHSPQKNPFLSRRICLQDAADDCPCCRGNDPPDMEVVRRWWLQVEELLEKYGRHLWYCRIELRWRLTRETLIQLGKFLRLMPELKVLQIDNVNHHRTPFSKREMKKLMAVKLPELKLVYLKVKNLPPLVLNCLAKSITSLEKFQVALDTSVLPFVYNRSLKEYDLRQLPSNMKEALLTIEGYDDFAHLQKMEPMPNLEKLLISLAFESLSDWFLKANSKWPEWNILFESLQKNFPNIKELDLRLPKAWKDKDKAKLRQQSLSGQLNLPNMKRLRIFIPNLASLDFLLPMQDLEELVIVLEHTASQTKECESIARKEKLKFNNRNLKTLDKSNIWVKFPKLKNLKIATHTRYSNGMIHRLKEFAFEKDGDYVQPVRP